MSDSVDHPVQVCGCPLNIEVSIAPLAMAPTAQGSRLRIKSSQATPALHLSRYLRPCTLLNKSQLSPGRNQSGMFCSAAYGPEAALTILLLLGLAGVAYIVPLSLTIVVLVSIVYFSYRQTIAVYPGGGGSYIVASANLGQWAGLLAGASQVLGYILNVAVLRGR